MPGKASLYGSFFVYSDREEVQDMEKAQDQEQLVEVFENDIQLYLTMFCEEQGIEDMRTASQSVWNAALMYIKRHVFNTTDILKSHDNIINKNSIMDSTYNAYNYDLVNTVCNYYIYICYMYDKEISINGFSYLTGINQQNIYNWGGDRVTKLSSKSYEVFKKLYDGREESLSAKLATANKNPVGILAILNRHYAWNLPGVSKEQTSKRALSAAELPKLDAKYAAETKEYAQIEDKN